MAGRSGKSELWVKTVTGAAILVIAFFAVLGRIGFRAAHPNLLVVHMLSRPSFWLVALLSVLLGLAFGQVKGNFRPLVAILTVVILFLLVLGTELLFLNHGVTH